MPYFHQFDAGEYWVLDLQDSTERILMVFLPIFLFSDLIGIPIIIEQ